VLVEREVHGFVGAEKEDSFARDGDSPFELGDGSLGFLLQNWERLNVVVFVALR
jgi:hypothetical protein